MDLKNKVIETLKSIRDPGTNIDLLKMDLVHDLEVTEDSVVFTFEPSSKICPLVFKLVFDIKNAINAISGMKKVDITVVNHIRADELNDLLSKD
ncbi:MAG: iron-sulfur cluster assembly protein [Promethearchaeota archaeon]